MVIAFQLSRVSRVDCPEFLGLSSGRYRRGVDSPRAGRPRRRTDGTRFSGTRDLPFTVGSAKEGPPLGRPWLSIGVDCLEAWSPSSPSPTRWHRVRKRRELAHKPAQA